MADALVNPEMLIWARLRAGFEEAEIARKLRVTESKVKLWEKGEQKPTFKQAQKFADCTYIPFSYLYFRQPPLDEVEIPDLRTIGDHAPSTISIDLKDTIWQVELQQDWYREYQLQQDASPIEVVDSMSLDEEIETVVANMRTKLDLPLEFRPKSKYHYLSDLVTRIENLGILVMRNSVVVWNTHRPLNVDEFRGFSMTDAYAPVIFVNTADDLGPQLFTLVHELAHIWFGESGISDCKVDTQNNIEKKCNAVAAEFLVPKDRFLQLWDKSDKDSSVRISDISKQFYVSRWVIARRALEYDLIPKEYYWKLVNTLKQQYLSSKSKRSNSGPSFAKLQTVRVGRRLASAVASETLSGRMFFKDAWELIGIKADKLRAYAREEFNI